MPGMFANPMGSRPTASPRTSLPFDEQIPGIPDFLRAGAPPIMEMPQQAQQPRQGGGSRRVFGIIADALAGAAGQPAMFAQNNFARQREERRRAEIEAQYERQRADARADFLFQERFKRENPSPVNNDTVADYNFIAERLGPDAARLYLQNKTLPPPFVQKNLDGTSTIYPRGLPRGAAGGPPPAAIAHLRANPALAADFDAKYGPGAAAAAMGGAGSGQRHFP